MKILCIIPIYNEENRLELLLKEIEKFREIDLNKINFLLINNGSNDNSEKIIGASNFKSIKLKKNRGIGYSLLLGLKIAHKKKYDILVHLAGNFKMSPFDIPKMLKPILEKKIDYVSGTRFLEKDNYENNPIFRKFSIKVLSFFFSFLFKRKITDATCGFRAFRVNTVIKNFSLFNKKKYYTYGYEYYSYGKILLSKNIKSCEASVKMNYPKKGRYSKIRPVIDWIPIIFGYLESLIDRKKLD